MLGATPRVLGATRECRVFSGIRSDPEMPNLITVEVMEILLSVIKLYLSMFPIIFRPQTSPNRLYHQHFRMGAVKLTFLKKTVMLRRLLGDTVQDTVG